MRIGLRFALVRPRAVSYPRGASVLTSAPEPNALIACRTVCTALLLVGLTSHSPQLSSPMTVTSRVP